jgi:antitoxin (DNA-binding transcriptional repressor) of toxin-antitoxin stability system
MAKRISAENTQAQLAELLTRVAENGERFVIERDGQPVAALVSIPELTRLEGAKRASPEEPGDTPEWKGFQSLVGIWPEVTDAEIDEMIAHIYADRERSIPRPTELGE